MATEEIKFTRATLNALPLPAARTYYKDKDTRGLRLAVWPNGTKAFEIYRKIGGKPTRIGLGHFDHSLPDSRVFPAGTDPISLVGNSPALNVAMVRILAGAVNAQLDIGVNPSEVKRSTRQAKLAEPTLQDAFDRYDKDYLIPKEKRTASDLRNMFDRNLGYVAPGQKKTHGKEKTKSPHGVDWSKRKLSDITAADVFKLHNKLKEGGSAYTANRTVQLLRTIYNKMTLWKLFSGDNPCDGIELFDEVERTRYIEESELPLFFAALDNANNENFKHFVWLSLFTGARMENILGMRWQDIDFGTGLWSIQGEVFKNGDLMTIPLTVPAIEALQIRKEAADGKSPFVFPARSKSGYMSAPKKHWTALLKNAGISDLHFHDLRRTLGSWSANTGASLHIIGKALGHKSIQTTLIYARLQGGAIKSATDLAAATMLEKGRVVLSGSIESIDDFDDSKSM